MNLILAIILIVASLLLGLVAGIAVGVFLCVRQEKKDGVYEMHHEIIRNKYGRDIDA